MKLKRKGKVEWEIPLSGNMRVPVVIYASESLIESIRRDMTLQQAQNVACLPGILEKAAVMPDGHQGYGFPIGGVAVFDKENGIISPGGVGYDINCGVRLLKTELAEEEVRDKLSLLMDGIVQDVPAGVGKGGLSLIGHKALNEVCIRGAQWAVANGYGEEADLQRTEEYGRFPGADPACLSPRAVERGVPQLGSLGAGNHFLEIQKVESIFAPDIARAFGIHSPGQVLVMIHCGSRGLGHQVASDYIRRMEDAFGFKDLPDRQLIHAPLRSPLGREYFRAMASAVNFAFANRQMIAHGVRGVFKRIMGSAAGMDQVYDVCHNVAKFEKHRILRREMTVCIHRKGATRSFGPGREEIPAVYRDVGQPVLIPGSMGTASYVLAGTREAEERSFGSTAHGAGRLMSRHEARRRFRGEQVKQEMAHRGILLRSANWKGVAEEAGQVYKDVDEVVRTSHEAGIGRLVARLVPLAVMKG